MERERGIIIVGNCRAGKREMMQQLLKENFMLVGFDNINSSMLGYTKALEHCANIHFKESIEEVKKLNHHFETTVAINYNLREELLKLAELEKTIQNEKLFEKPQSKFISRPRHNFRKR